MAADSDTDDRIDVADHVVATSESEDPEETVARLFGEHDPEEATKARETIAKLFGEHDPEEVAAVRETMATLLGGRDRRAGGDGPPDERDVACDGVDPLGPDEETRHEVHLGDEVAYAHCVDGALITAELADREPVTVRSFDPVGGEPVIFEIAADRRAVRPDDAVVSMGMARAAADAGDMISFGVGMAHGEEDPEPYVDDPRDVFCRNFNAFESRENYERWAADADAVSVAVPAEVFASLIHDLVSGPAFE